MPARRERSMQGTLLLCAVLALGLLAATACQSHGPASAATCVAKAAAAGPATARFQCGPTDDVELALVMPAPRASDETAGTLHLTLGSEQWRRIECGERLDFAPGEAARWCMAGGGCEQPDQVLMAFERVSLEHGGELAGTVEIRLDRRTVSLPVAARVERSSQRCG